MAEPLPPESPIYPAYIVKKGTKIEGAYLRLGLAKQISQSKWLVDLSFFAGSHYGGGFQVTVIHKDNHWVAYHVKSTFIS